MCYIIAKKYNERGCIALKYEHSYKLASLIKYLTIETNEKGKEVEVFIIGNNTEVYGEYAPYTFIENEIEFINKVLSM